MTRKLAVVEQFEAGTLLEAAPHPEYADWKAHHAYYVPDKARRVVGLEKVSETDDTSGYVHVEAHYDRDEVLDLVSAEDIVERVEEQVLNRTEGDVGNTSATRMAISVSRRGTSDDEPTIPDGVVKFADSELHAEDGPSRDPVERGRCWGTVQDRLKAGSSDRLVDYQDELRLMATQEARVPLDVVQSGDDAVAMYLAAHDHHARRIAHVLDREPTWVSDVVGSAGQDI